MTNRVRKSWQKAERSLRFHQASRKPSNSEAASVLDETYIKSYNDFDSASSTNSIEELEVAHHHQHPRGGRSDCADNYDRNHCHHYHGRNEAGQDQLSRTNRESLCFDRDNDQGNESDDTDYIEIVDDSDGDSDSDNGDSDGDDNDNDNDNNNYNYNYNNNDNDNDNDNDRSPPILPSPRGLSKELSKLVFGLSRSNCSYSQYKRSALRSLVTLSGWVETKDPIFLKHFLTQGGVVKVLGFLQEVVREEEECNYKQQQQHRKRRFPYRFAIECIKHAASVISGVCCVCDEVIQGKSNRDHRHTSASSISVSLRFLMGVTATVIVNHGGIETMLLASDLCCRCSQDNNQDTKPSSFDAEASLEASQKIWEAIANTCSSVRDETTTMILEDSLLVSLWDTGFEVMEVFGFDFDNHRTTEATFLLWASVFRIFKRLLVHSHEDFFADGGAIFEEFILCRALYIVTSMNSNSSDDDDDASARTGVSSISMSFHSQGSSSSNQEMSFGTKEGETYLEEVLSFFCECQTQELLFRTKEATPITTSTPTTSPTSPTSIVTRATASTAASTVPSSTTSTATKETDQNSSNDTSNGRWRQICEALIPLCVNGLQKFAMDNPRIRRTAVRILDASLSSSSKNQQQQVLLTELTHATCEAVAPCLASEAVDEIEKDEIKGVVRKIAVLIYYAVLTMQSQDPVDSIDGKILILD